VEILLIRAADQGGQQVSQYPTNQRARQRLVGGRFQVVSVAIAPRHRRHCQHAVQFLILNRKQIRDVLRQE